MKKIILISVVYVFQLVLIPLILMTWSNNDLCGWTTSSSTPENIQKEIEKREMLCYGGVEVSSLPTEEIFN